MKTRIANRLELVADYDVCGDKIHRAKARVYYLIANLLDGYGVRKSVGEFINPPYGA